jgi:endonuclease/exonuclease/phosphatase family metal-dependent hydrolase
MRVATYNVHSCIGTDGRHDPDRIAAVIAELDADIVALQEFTYPASVALDTRSPVVLTTLDSYTCALGPTRQNITQCFGNALFTRHPIVDVHRIDLSMERREPRGAIAATVNVRGELVHVLAAHLGLRVRERRFQVRQIAEYLDSVRNTLFVVLGDFNDWLPGRSVVHVLDHRLGRQPRPASFPVKWPIVALDRIWVHPTRALRRVFTHSTRTARVASDHFPVVAEIEPGRRISLPCLERPRCSSSRSRASQPVGANAARGVRRRLDQAQRARRGRRQHANLARRHDPSWPTCGFSSSSRVQRQYRCEK